MVKIQSINMTIDYAENEAKARIFDTLTRKFPSLKDEDFEISIRKNGKFKVLQGVPNNEIMRYSEYLNKTIKDVDKPLKNSITYFHSFEYKAIENIVATYGLNQDLLIYQVLFATPSYGIHKERVQKAIDVIWCNLILCIRKLLSRIYLSGKIPNDKYSFAGGLKIELEHEITKVEVETSRGTIEIIIKDEPHDTIILRFANKEIGRVSYNVNMTLGLITIDSAELYGGVIIGDILKALIEKTEQFTLESNQNE